MRRLAITGILSAVLLWGGYTVFSLWGDNYALVVPEMVLKPDNSDWQMWSGQGRKLGDAWAIQSSGRRGYSRIGIGLPWPASVDQYDEIRVHLGQRFANRPMSVGWSRSSTVSPRSQVQLEAVSDKVAAVQTNWLSPQDGQVQLIILELFKVDEEPFLVEQVRLVPAKPGFVALQSRLFGEWFRFARWTQRSSNHTRTAEQPILVSPAVAVGAWVLVSWLIVCLLSRFRGSVIWSAFACFFVLGWIVLDIRWQADLAGKSLTTLDSFHGKSWESRRAADIDGPLFEFVRKLKEEVGLDRRRLFALGHGEYWRLRARYHALPWSTRSTDKVLVHNWTRYLRKGDLFLKLDAPHVVEKKHPIKASHDYRFSKEFDVSEVVGNGATLSSGMGGSLVEVAPDSRELIRSLGNSIPGRAFYRLTVRLRALDGEAPARLIARWRDGEGQMMTSADRLHLVSASEFREYALTFVVPRYEEVDFYVVSEANIRLQLKAMRLELLDGEGLVWLKSGEKGPLLVVRPLLVERLNRAYEVM